MRRSKARLCALMMMGLTVLTSPATIAAGPGTAETQTYIREWRYKVIGDHLYKRLYNASTGRWETDWILVQ